MAGGIKEWPEDERPREKLIRRGAEGLSDAELLALVLRTGDHASGMSAVDMGRALVAAFGDLRRVAGATVAEICGVRGVGPAKAAAVKAALEMAKRVNTEKLSCSDRFTSPEQI